MTSVVTFDTDAIIQRLRRHGMSEEAAREFVQAIRDAQSELASKADLREAVLGLKIWTGGVAVVSIGVLATLKYFG